MVDFVLIAEMYFMSARAFHFGHFLVDPTVSHAVFEGFCNSRFPISLSTKVISFTNTCILYFLFRAMLARYLYLMTFVSDLFALHTYA